MLEQDGQGMAPDPVASYRIPPLTYERVARLGRTNVSHSRRSFLKAAAALGTGVAFAALGLFPLARRARADGYDIAQSCPGNPSSEYGGCLGCYGSTVCTPSPCGSCCTSADCWHRDDGANHWLRPNQCQYAGGAPGYDGWKWKTVSGCAGCSGSTPYALWRCHDGYTRLETGAALKTVCSKRVGCVA